MRKFFQTFGFRDSAYHRPFQKWVCGRTADGHACLLGPGDRGECRIRFECHPVRNGDRWVCTRPEGAGGKCAAGPLSDGSCERRAVPCMPVRSLRARRGLTARWMAALTVGLLLILFGGSQEYQTVSQGDLTAPHAEFGANCASCHTAVESSPIDWVGIAINTPVSTADGQLCLTCHKMGEESFFPHHRTSDEVAALRESAQPPSAFNTEPVVLKLAERIAKPAVKAGEVIACATCHREHQGADAALTEMSNVRCQSCHTNQFDGLAKGHPEFDKFPYDRRTRLTFDHIGHIGRHFRDPRLVENAPSECSSCHVPDTLGQGMMVRGFDSVCAACHEPQIVEAGVPILIVPGIDVLSLQDMDVDIGYWPEYAEGEITPFMELLLNTDDDFVAARNALADIDLLDLQDVTEEEAQAAATVAWSIKSLLADIIIDGAPGLRERLEQVAGSAISDGQMAAMAGTMPVDTVRAIQERWFPQLLEEVSAQAADEPLPYVEEPEEPNLPEGAVDDTDWAENGGWYFDEYSILYRPLDHADPLLAGWLDFAAMASGAGNADVALFDRLAATDAPGSCGKCHSVDMSQDGQLTVNWLSKRLDPQEHRFTDFYHVSHFNLSGITGCTDCHVLDSQSPYLTGFKDRDPATFHANFEPIERQVCAECHVPQQAGDGCTKCHNYHVGTFPPAVIAGPLMMRTEAGEEIDAVTGTKSKAP